MCEWPSTSAGITVLPVRSTRAAPAGACTSPLRPTRVNRAFSTRNAEFSIGAPPSPAISRAPSNSVTRRAGAWAAVSIEPAVQKKQRKQKIFRIRLVA